MSYDTELVFHMLDKKVYDRLSPFIKEYSVSKECWKVVRAMGEYYKSYPSSTSVDVSSLQLYYFALHASTAKGDEYTLMSKFFTDVAKCATSTKSLVAADVIAHYVKQDYATQIANKAIKIAQGTDKDPLDVVGTLVQKYNKEVGTHVTKEDLFVTTNLSDVTKACSAPGLMWRLKELNLSLGPVRLGDFIIVAARPETGKTTMMASEVSYFATQITGDRPIIWVNNEERSDKVMHRIMQSHFGVTNADIASDPKTYEERFKKDIGNRILVLKDDTSVNNVRSLDSIFAEYNPCMIIFDQLDKVRGFDKADRDDLRIGHLYEWARDKAKEYGPTIAVSQVDGTGEGQKWIVMNQLRGSKTDKIGEADAIIAIGRINDPAFEYNRYLHIPKNKLFGGGISDEAYRHGYFELMIEPAIGRYKGGM